MTLGERIVLADNTVNSPHFNYPAVTQDDIKKHDEKK